MGLYIGQLWSPVELSFVSKKHYENPYLQVEVVVCFTSPSGTESIVQGFWEERESWKVRFAPSEEGTWTWRSEASDTGNEGLHARTGSFKVVSDGSDNPITRHGFLRVGANQRTFEHNDGTPFFWMGDTVWAASAKAELSEWINYVEYRKRQGFNIVQLNSLPQHDASIPLNRMPFEIRDGMWDLSQPIPGYFQVLDDMIEIAKDAGMFVAIVALWFDYVPGTNLWWSLRKRALFDPASAERYGRYLGARYSAYGAIWIVCGDSDFETPEASAVYDAAATGIREAGGCHSIMTAHLHSETPTPIPLNTRHWLDFHMYQSGHHLKGFNTCLSYAETNRNYYPPRPVVNGEPCYEGLAFKDHATGEMIPITRGHVRETAWKSVLGGSTAGITYGAHGLWSWHCEKDVFPFAPPMPEPLPWYEAMRMPGAEDVARLRQTLCGINWWELHRVHALLANDFDVDYVAAATIEMKVIVIYVKGFTGLTLHLPSRNYNGVWFNPATEGSIDALLTCVMGEDGLIEVAPPSWDAEAVLILRSEEDEDR